MMNLSSLITREPGERAIKSLSNSSEIKKLNVALQSSTSNKKMLLNLRNQIIRIKGCCRLSAYTRRATIFITLPIIIITTCSFISSAHSNQYNQLTGANILNNLSQQAIDTYNKSSFSTRTISNHLNSSWPSTVYRNDVNINRSSSSNSINPSNSRYKLLDKYLLERDFDRLFSLGFNEIIKIIDHHYLSSDNVQHNIQQKDLKGSNSITLKSEDQQHPRIMIKRFKRNLNDHGNEPFVETSLSLPEVIYNNSNKSIEVSGTTTEAPQLERTEIPVHKSTSPVSMQLIAAESSVPANHAPLPREGIEDETVSKSKLKQQTSPQRSRSHRSSKAKNSPRSHSNGNEKVTDEYSTPGSIASYNPESLSVNDALIENPIESAMRYSNGITTNDQQSDGETQPPSHYPIEAPIISGSMVAGRAASKTGARKRSQTASETKYSSAHIPAPEQNPLKSNNRGPSSTYDSSNLSDSPDQTDEEQNPTRSLNLDSSAGDAVILDHSGSKQLQSLTNEVLDSLKKEQVMKMMRLLESSSGSLAKNTKKPNHPRQEEYSFNTNSMRLQNSLPSNQQALYSYPERAGSLELNSNEQENQKLLPIDNVSRTNAPYEAIDPSLIPSGVNYQQQLVPVFQSEQSNRHSHLNQERLATPFSNQFDPSSINNNNNNQQVSGAIQGQQKLGNSYVPSFSAPFPQQSLWSSSLSGTVGKGEKEVSSSGAQSGKLQILNLPSSLRDAPRMSSPVSAKLKTAESRHHANTAASTSSPQVDHYFSPRAIPVSSAAAGNGYRVDESMNYEQPGSLSHLQQNQMLAMLRAPQTMISPPSSTSSLLSPNNRLYATSPLIRRTSPILMLNPAGSAGVSNGYSAAQLRALKTAGFISPSSLTAMASDGLPLSVAYSPSSSLSPYLSAAAAKYSRALQQQQQQVAATGPTNRIMTAYQNRVGRVEGGGGFGEDSGAQASMSNPSTSDPMWSNSQNHEEDYQQSPQTIQITAVPNGLGLANGFNGGFAGLNGWNGLNGFAGGWGGPWNGRQVLLVNKQPQVGSEWRNWMIPVAIILALPLILGALFVPVFLKSVMFLIQILQMLGLLMPPSQLASHLLSNSHNQSSG